MSEGNGTAFALTPVEEGKHLQANGGVKNGAKTRNWKRHLARAQSQCLTTSALFHFMRRGLEIAQSDDYEKNPDRAKYFEVWMGWFKEQEERRAQHGGAINVVQLQVPEGMTRDQLEEYGRLALR